MEYYQARREACCAYFAKQLDGSYATEISIQFQKVIFVLLGIGFASFSISLSWVIVTHSTALTLIGADGFRVCRMFVCICVC